MTANIVTALHVGDLGETRQKSKPGLRMMPRSYFTDSELSSASRKEKETARNNFLCLGHENMMHGHNSANHSIPPSRTANWERRNEICTRPLDCKGMNLGGDQDGCPLSATVAA